MVFITIESYKNAGVDVIKDNKDYFWVKMKDVQDGLGFKKEIKEMQDILILKNLLKNKKENT